MPDELCTYMHTCSTSVLAFKEAFGHAVGPWNYNRLTSHSTFNFHSLSDHFVSQISLQVIAGMVKGKKNLSHTK